MDPVQRFMEIAWKTLMLRGILLLVFGIAILVWPQLTVSVLVFIVALFLLLSGAISVVSGLFGIGKMKMWFLTVVVGVIELGLGIFLIRNTATALKYIIVLIGLYLFVVGIIQIINSFDKSLSTTFKVLGIIVGLITLLVGVLVALHPEATGVAFALLLGIYGVIAGPIDMAMALDVRNALKDVQES